MSTASVKVTPFTTAIGAEISGVDLGKPLGAAVSDYMPHYRCMNRITVVNDRRTGIKAKKSAAA